MTHSRITQGKPSLEEAMTSIYWEVFAELVLDRLNQHMGRLRKCKVEELGNLQGKIEELEYLLGLPDQTRAERKRKEK